MNEHLGSRDRFGKDHSPSSRTRMTLAETVLVGSILAISAFLTAIIQTSFFYSFRPFGLAPDLCLCLTAATGVIFGTKCGGLTGLFSGFFISAFAGSGISVAPLLYMLFGCAAGIAALPSVNRRFSRLSLFLITTAAGALISLGISIFLTLVFGEASSVPSMLLRTLIPEFACTLAFSFTVYLPASLAMTIIKKRQGFHLK